MATRRSAASTAQEQVHLTNQDIGSFALTGMSTYGKAVNEERSVPAISDGLKPSVRRLIWAANAVAREKVKGARLVGETIGLFHPHGDVSAYQALVTAVNASVPPFTGLGNWGSLVDSAAAQRYTNVSLSHYGMQFLSPAYLAVTPMVQNFDGTRTEPLTLPALLPNILFNDTSGIGVGLTTRLPGFHPISVLKLMCRLLAGEKLSPADYASSLKFYEAWGGCIANVKQNKQAVLDLMTTPQASIIWEARLDVEREKKRIRIESFPPDFNAERFLVAARDIDGVSSVHPGRGVSFVVTVRRDVNFNSFDVIVEAVRKLTRTTQRYSICVTDRVSTGDDKYNVEFHRLSVKQLAQRWLTYRVKLEVASLTWRASETQRSIDRLTLLLHAAKPECLKIIFAALQQDDTEGRIARGLGISVEEARIILELKVRQLSKLDVTKLKDDLNKQQSRLKLLQKQIKAPLPVVRDYFERCIVAFKQAPRDPAMFNLLQWWLASNVTP